MIHAHILNRVILQDITMMYSEECVYSEECDTEYFYDDKDYYNDDSLDDLEDDDDQNPWIDLPTSPLLLSKIYFGDQTS